MDISRNTALNILIEYDKSGSFPNLSLKKHLRSVVSERDRAFSSAIVYGVIEKKFLLDYYISRVSSVKIKKINTVVLNILRMGLYQIIFMSTPESAACNTSVDLAKKNGQIKSAAFVNAILRKLAKTYKEIDVESDSMLSVKHSVGDCVFNVLVNTFGIDGFVDYITSDIDKSIYIAVNTCKICSSDLIKLLSIEGVCCETTTFDGLLKIKGALSVEESSAFKSGLYHIIGLPSYLAARALSPRSSEVIYDMCSAPGGKTFAIAYMSHDKGKITAFDIHEHKILNLKRDLSRLSLRSVTPVLCDSSENNKKFYGSADKVLCDVPCSGIGMLHKKPDIKYNTIDFASLTNVQYSILCNAAMYLKSGGRLVYSTCTVNPDENDRIVDRFISENSNFSIDNNVEIYNGNFGTHTFLPQIDKTDGFYIAVLKKD